MNRCMLKQISCPKSPSSNKGIDKVTRVWYPLMNKYGFKYTGIVNTPKLAIGENKFFNTNQTCDMTSEHSCIGEKKHYYLRGYPTGKMPIGQSGLIGSIQEDIVDLNLTDYSKALVNQGPYASNSCVLKTLPVGNKLNQRSKQRKDEAEFDANDKNGWFFQSKCVPRGLVENYSNNSCIRMKILIIFIVILLLFVLKKM